MQKERIIASIFTAIEETNQGLPEEERLEKSIEVILLGISSKLDSLGLVNLIVATEQTVEEEFGVPITLADERAMSQKSSPFRTVGTLADYIALLLEENGAG